MNILSSALYILGIFFAVVGVITLSAVFWSRRRTVAMIDVKTIPVDRTEQIKEQIVAERILRKVSAKAKPVKVAVGTAWEFFQNRFRHLAKAAFDMEKRSERLARGSWDALTAGTKMHATLNDADKLSKEGKFVEAEKNYMDALSLDMKNPKLYEKLGTMYIRAKSYTEARETLRYASRLSPNDASVVAALGEVAMAQGEYPDAITYFEHAAEIRPRSPKYLNFLIQACLAGKNKVSAENALRRLADVNPENAKLVELDQRIKGMV
jgi:tetratricopeptide (TPR) repeat protein